MISRTNRPAPTDRTGSPATVAAPYVPRMQERVVAVATVLFAPMLRAETGLGVDVGGAVAPASLTVLSLGASVSGGFR
jgi:hypothetical protein